MCSHRGKCSHKYLDVCLKYLEFSMCLLPSFTPQYTQPHDESEGDGASDSSENDERPGTTLVSVYRLWNSSRNTVYLLEG